MENTNTELNAEQQQLAALLTELNLDDDEIIEPAEPSVTTDELGQVSLSDAIADLEREDQLEALYAEADAQKAAEAAQKEQEELFDPSAGIDPTLLLGTPPVEETPKPTKKAAKPKVKAEPKVKQKKEAAKPEVKTEEQPAPQPEVKKPEPRKHYASKVERLNDRMGDRLNEYSVLEIDDAEKDVAALREYLNKTMKAAGVKVQNRMGFFVEYVSGRSQNLNSVCADAVRVLLKDGKITTGDKGNLHKLLLGRYSVASAKAMGGNTILAMQKLKMIVGEKGNWMPNPDSLYLMKLKGMLAIPDAA